MLTSKRITDPRIGEATAVDFNELPDEVELPIMAAVGGGA